jgi:hypothetical protein
MTVGHNPPVPVSPRRCIWLSGPGIQDLDIWLSGPGFQDLDIWLSGLGFQDLDKRTYIGRRKLSILRLLTGAPSCVLFFSRHFSLRPSDFIYKM